MSLPAAPAFHDLSRADAPAQLAELARGHLSAAGQVQVGVCLRMLAAVDAGLGWRPPGAGCWPPPGSCAARRSSLSPSTASGHSPRWR
jgi:hypothetical protein